MIPPFCLREVQSYHALLYHVQHIIFFLAGEIASQVSSLANLNSTFSPLRNA